MASRALAFSMLCFAICISGGCTKSARRIADGTDAGHVPYMVSIRSDGFGHFCGGSIIDERHILTAAHCIIFGRKLAEGTKVLIGTNDVKNDDTKNEYGVERILPHKHYRRFNGLKNDIAVLQLDRNITFNEYQRPILLPLNNTEEGKELTVTGWGDAWEKNYEISSRYLRKMTTKIVSNEQCQKIISLKFVKLEKEYICSVGASSVCQYDSGSPLVDGPYLVGIVSTGGCKPYYPNVYTRVYEYVPWIKETIADSARYPVENEEKLDIRR